MTAPTLASRELSAIVALQLAERGFFVKEIDVGSKEWTHNRHPTREGRAETDGVRCSCSASFT